MSVNSVLPGLPPSCGPIGDIYSQTRKSGAFATRLPDQASTAAAGAQAKSSDVNDSGYGSQLEQELRAGTAGARGATSESSGRRGGQATAGIALYQRVSQIGSDETTPSALLKRWNSIIQSEQDGGESPPSQHNSAARFDSGILDLTA